MLFWYCVASALGDHKCLTCHNASIYTTYHNGDSKHLVNCRGKTGVGRGGGGRKKGGGLGGGGRMGVKMVSLTFHAAEYDLFYVVYTLMHMALFGVRYMNISAQVLWMVTRLLRYSYIVLQTMYLIILLMFMFFLLFALFSLVYIDSSCLCCLFLFSHVYVVYTCLHW